MRCLHLFAFSVLFKVFPLRFLFILSYISYFCLLNDNINFTNASPSPAPFPLSKKDYENKLFLQRNLEISLYGAIKTSIFGTAVVLFLINVLFYVAHSVKFVKFTTNLSTRPKATIKQPSVSPMIAYVLIGLLLTEYEECWYFVLCSSNFNLFSVKFPSKGTTNFSARLIFILITIHILHISYTPLSNVLCLITLQNCCYFFF